MNVLESDREGIDSSFPFFFSSVSAGLGSNHATLWLCISKCLNVCCVLRSGSRAEDIAENTPPTTRKVLCATC